MKLYIWQRLSNVTSRYHSEAGICVIAPDLDYARKMIVSYSDAEGWDDPKDKTEKSWASLSKTDDEAGLLPDLVLEVDPKAEPQIFVFPDAGCC